MKKKASKRARKKLLVENGRDELAKIEHQIRKELPAKEIENPNRRDVLSKFIKASPVIAGIGHVGLTNLFTQMWKVEPAEALMQMNAMIKDIAATGNSWGRDQFDILGLPASGNETVPRFMNETWRHINAGTNHVTAIDTDGKAFCWGANDLGQIGINTSGTPVATPTEVNGSGDWSWVNGGYGWSHGIKQDGTLWSWGVNGVGELALGDITDRSVPVQVGSLTDWKKVGSGDTHSVALKTNGTLWSWGNNAFSQLGTGAGPNQSDPVQIGSQTDWRDIAVGGYHTLAIKTDGSLWGWGFNGNGSLGLSNTTPYNTPQLIDGGNWFKASATLYRSMAIKNDGTLWTWGNNAFGELGDQSSTHRSSPVQVLGTWRDVAGGYQHTMGIRTDETLWCWGRGQHGRLGNGYTNNYSSPVLASGGGNWVAVTGSRFSSFGRRR